MECHKCGIETEKSLTGLCATCLEPEVDMMIEAILTGQAKLGMVDDETMCVTIGTQAYIDYCQSFRPTGRQ